MWVEQSRNAPLVEADDSDEVRDTSFRLGVLAPGSRDEDVPPAAKYNRSAVMKCSPSTISKGSGRGIIGRL